MATRPDLAPQPWQPQNPAAAVGDRATYNEPMTGGKPYTPAPAGSHLFGFILRDDSFSRNHVAPANGFPAGTALIQIAFKPPKVNGVHPNSIAAEYLYGPTQPGAAATYYAKLVAADQPGKVERAMFAAGVPHRRAASTS